jgi:hypothetical protein
MENLLCHSGMLLGSVLSLVFVVASAGGLGLLTVLGLRRTIRRPANS